VKTRIQNLESRIQKIGGSHARGRAQGKANFVWAEVGKDGKNQAQKWEKAVQNLGFFQDNSEVSRLFLPLPGISHLFPLDFFSGAKWPSGQAAKRSLEPRWGSAGRVFWRVRYALELDWGMK